MAETKTRLGRLPCTGIGCGHSVMVQQNSAGTLSMACDECGWSCFAKKGETQHAKMLKALEPKQAPAKPAETGRQAFALGNL